MSGFQIFTPAEIDSVRRAGKVLSACLRHCAGAVRPGMTTGELDAIAEAFILSHDGATPAFKGYRNYPATLCTSVNDECVHGLPGNRVLRDGDIIGIDCGVLVDGLYTDACVTAGVGTVAPETQKFLDVSKAALDKAVSIVRPNLFVGDISAVIQEHVEGNGYTCVNGLTGHGLGKTLHQFPDIPNRGEKGSGPRLPAWTVIAIEPITSMGRPEIKDASDGWTIATKDGSLSAHFEHTVLVTVNGHEILA